MDKDYVLKKLNGRYTVDKETNCWIWNGTTEENKDYYPQLSIDGTIHYVHKLIAYIYGNEIGIIKHSCKNKRCINPDHLRVAKKNDKVVIIPQEINEVIVRYMEDSKTIDRNKAILDLLSMGINYHYYIKEEA